MPASRQKRSFPRRCLDVIGHLVFLACVAAIVFLLHAATIVFLPFRKQAWTVKTVQFLFRRVLGALWACGAFLRLIRVSVEGEPASNEPLVFVANHPSFVDALLLIPRLPRTMCIYKAGLERNFLPRSMAAKAGFISNAGPVESIREGVDRLREGWRILLFPEGTRTKIPPMGAWKSSYALMAARAGVPIQPVYMAIHPPLWPKGEPWWKPPEFPVQVRIRFGLSIPPPNEHTTRNFHRDTEASFRHELIKHQNLAGITSR